MVRRNLIASVIATSMVVGAGITAASSMISARSDSADTARQAQPASESLAALPPVTVFQDQFVDDLVYVPSPGAVEAEPGIGSAAAPTTAAPPTPARAASAAPPATDLGGSPVAADPTTPSPTNPPRWTAPPAPSSPVAPTTAPKPTTTQPSTPTANLPAGAEVPKDWPAGMPYPPIPPGCVKPHLEDNGVWNCEH